MRTIALTTTLALCACSSSYLPQSRGRVAVTMRDGAQAYVRDGKVYSHGFLGGGLVDAVEGHPAATVAANEYRDRIKFGLLGMVAGLGAMIGGTAYAVSQVDPVDETRDDDAKVRTGLLVALAGAVVMMAGAGYLATAEPYRWDAINLFNDSPPPPTFPPGVPPGYGWSAQKATLKMRD